MVLRYWKKNHGQLPGTLVLGGSESFFRKFALCRKFANIAHKIKFRHKLVENQEERMAYEAFKTNVYSPRSVLYPCCGTDATPSKVFDNVINIDISPSATLAMMAAGYNAITMDIKKYKPAEKHDLIVLSNSHVRVSDVLDYLKVGGYVLSNNWTHSAEELWNQPEKFEIVCCITTIKKRAVILDEHETRLHPPGTDVSSGFGYGHGFYVFKKSAD